MYNYRMTAALFGAAATIALVQPQIAVALSPDEMGVVKSSWCSGVLAGCGRSILIEHLSSMVIICRQNASPLQGIRQLGYPRSDQRVLTTPGRNC